MRQSDIACSVNTAIHTFNQITDGLRKNITAELDESTGIVKILDGTGKFIACATERELSELIETIEQTVEIICHE